MRRSLWLFLGIVALQGHDLYILPARFFLESPGELKIAFHNGDAFPESEASPVLNRVCDTNLVSAAGILPMTDLRVEGKRAMALVAIQRPGEQILTIRTVPNLITLPPDQFLGYLKEEGLEHVIKWREEHLESSKPGRERYSKFAKSIVLDGASDGFYNHEIGFPIEIVPERDPYGAKAGEALPVGVNFRGKPAAGLQLEAAWAGKGESRTTIVGRTDLGGRISVRLERAGLWRLHTLKMERCSEPDVADWESLWASLTFEIR